MDYLILESPIPCTYCDNEAVVYDSFSLELGSWCQECYDKTSGKD